MTDDDTPSLSDRLGAARERERRQQDQREQKALARPRGPSDEILDAAIAHGDQTVIAGLAEQRFVEPGDALIAAGIVNYYDPESRPYSVWKADCSLAAARYPDRMDDIAGEARYKRQVEAPIANPEVRHRILDAIIDKSFETMFDGFCDDAIPQGYREALEQQQPQQQEQEPDRPVERLAGRIRM